MAPAFNSIKNLSSGGSWDAENRLPGLEDVNVPTLSILLHDVTSCDIHLYNIYIIIYIHMVDEAKVLALNCP
jgi:hypothetical protein